MARRSIILAAGVIAALAALLPATATAATAPAAAPVLTSAPYATLVSFHWTPGSGAQHVAVGLPQRRRRARRRSPPASARTRATRTRATRPPTTSTTVADGVYCYYIQAADPAGDGQQPGPDRDRRHARPGGDDRHPERRRGCRQRHVVTLAATSADAASGVASSVLHVGAVGACPSRPVMGATWDTTTVAERRLRRLQRRHRQRRPRRDRDHHRDRRERAPPAPPPRHRPRAADTTGARIAPTKLSARRSRARSRARSGCACDCAGSSRRRPTSSAWSSCSTASARRRTRSTATVVYRGLGTSAVAEPAGRPRRATWRCSPTTAAATSRSRPGGASRGVAGPAAPAHRQRRGRRRRA